jgi:outer membrane protein assembly factor BamB
MLMVSLAVAHAWDHRTKFAEQQRSIRMPSYAVLDERAQPLIASSGKVGFVSSVTSGSVMAFGLASGKVLSAISVGEGVGPISMIEHGGRRLIAAASSNDPRQGNPATVTIIDATSTRAMETKSLLVLPSDAIITAATRALLSSNGKLAFIASSFEEATLFSFDVETGQVVSQIALPGRPSEVAIHDHAGQRAIAVASASANVLSLIGFDSSGQLSSLASFTPKGGRFEDSNNPVFSTDGSAVFIGAAEGNRLYAVDSSTGAEIASARVTSPRRVSVARRGGGQVIAVTRVQNPVEGRGGVTIFSTEAGSLDQVSSFDPPDDVNFSHSNNPVFTSDASTVIVGSTTGILFAFATDTGQLESFTNIGSELRRVALSEKAKAVAAVRSAPTGDEVVVVTFDVDGEEPDPTAPIIDSLHPNVVEQGRLKNVKLTVLGSNFTDGASLIVNGNEIAADVVRDGAALQTKLPKSMFDHVGSISVRIRGVNGAVSEERTLSITRPNAPIINKIDPTEVPGPAEPFTLVVKGSNFRDSSTIFIGDNALNTERIDNRKLKAIVPADIAASVGIKKVVVRDLAVSDLFSPEADLLIFGPRISAIRTSVNAVVAGDKRFVMKIVGENFRPGATVALTLNDHKSVPDSVKVKNKKLIRVLVKSRLFQEAGTMKVVVRNAAGGTSEPGELPIHAPEILSFEPGKVLAGLSDVDVTLRGTNFRKRARVFVGNQDNAVRVDHKLVRFRGSRRIVVSLTQDLNSLLTSPGEVKFTVVNPNDSDGVPSAPKSLGIVGPTISEASVHARDDGMRRIVIVGDNFRKGAVVEFLVDGMVVRQQAPDKASTDRISLQISRKKLEGMGNYEIRVVNPSNVASDPVSPRQEIAAAVDEQ